MPKLLVIAENKKELPQLRRLIKACSPLEMEWETCSTPNELDPAQHAGIRIVLAHGTGRSATENLLRSINTAFPDVPIVLAGTAQNEPMLLEYVGKQCDDLLITSDLTPALFHRCIRTNLQRKDTCRNDRSKLQSIIDETPIGVLVMSPDGSVLMRNKHHKEFLKTVFRDSDQNEGSSIFEHMQPQDKPIIQARLAELLRNDTPDHLYDVTCRVNRSSRDDNIEKTVSLSLNATLIRDQNECPREVLLTCIDISEQLASQQLIKQTAQDKEELLIGLLSMQRELGDCRDVREMAKVILTTALARCNIECGYCFVRENDEELSMAAHVNIADEIIANIPEVSMNHPIIKGILTNDCYGKVHHTTELIATYFPEMPFHHIFTITMRTGGHIIGFLNLATAEDEIPDEQTRQILGILMHEAETFFTRIRYEDQMKLLNREMEQSVIDRTQALQTKIKELHGLHGFSKLAEQEGATNETVAEGLIHILPDSMQRPDIACARIQIGNQILQTANFKDSPWTLSAEIKAGTILYGNIVVGYIEERMPNHSHSEVFSAGEKALVETTARRLGQMIEREKTADALTQSEQQYRNLFYHLNDAAVLCEHESGRIVDVNKAAVHLFRNAETKLLDQNLFTLCPTNDFAWDPGKMQELRNSSTPLSCEGVIHTKDDAEVSLVINATQITISNHPFLLVLMRDVTQQKRADLHKELLNDVFRLFSARADSEITHQELLNLISSRFKNIDMILFIYDRENAQHLSYTSTENELDLRSKKSFSPDTTFAGKAIRQCEPIWYADIQTHEDLKEYSLFQNGVRSVLSIPIMSKGNAIGALTAYTDSVTPHLHTLTDILIPITNAIAGEIIRKDAEQHIRRHDAILDAINYAAEQFINNPYNQADMSQVLAMLGYAANVDRVYIFENHTNDLGQLCMSQRVEWCTGSVKPEIDNPALQNLPYKDSFSRWVQVLGNENSVFGNVCDFPATERALLETQNIQSLAVVPIFCDTTWWGFLGFDDCKKEHMWAAMELEALRTAADVIGASVARQRSEEALRESEEQLRIMFERSLDIILIINPDDGRIIRANAASYRILGYEPEQLIGEKISYILPLRQYQEFDALPDLLQDQTIFKTQKFIRFDGGLCTMDLTAAAIPWKNRHAVLVTLRDVSERELSEEILKRNEERYRRIFEESPVSLWERDYSRALNYLEQLLRRGVSNFEEYFEKNPADLRWCMRLIKTIDVNHTSLSMFTAKSKEELIQRSMDIYGPDISPCFSKEIVALANRKRDLNLECVQHDLNGNELNLLMRWSVIPGFEENYKRVLVSYIDITSQRKAEREAKLRTEQLMQAEKMVALGTLVAGVAHEINNPNSFVTLNIPLVTNAWEKAIPILDEHCSKHGDFNLGIGDYSEMRDEIGILLNDVMEGARRIRTIVKDLKDFARQSPSEAFDRVSINDIARSATALLRNSIKKHTRKFTISYCEEVPLIQANMQRLEQVLINLIINACQSLPDPDRSITVSTSSHPRLGEIHITVQDEGIGIAEEQLRHIMDPFFTTKRDAGGTGLGLSISSTIMEEHGGRLAFNSIHGAGTTATMILPTRPALSEPPSQ